MESVLTEETAQAGVDQAEQAVTPTAGDTEPALQPQAATEQAAAPAAETAEQGEELLTAEEQQRLLTHPEVRKVYKQLQKSYTQKTQRLAEERRQLQGVLQDPQSLALLAQRVGLPTAGAQPPATQQQKDDAFEAIAEAFGPEWAQKLMPAFEKLVERRVEPYKQAQEQFRAQYAYQQSMSALNSLVEQHPDAIQYQDEMNELAQKLEPRGMPEDEYLELLYNTVKWQKGGFEAAAAKKVLSRVAASAAAGETQARTLAPNKVAKSAPPDATPRDAILAAMRGDRWDG